jgi:hypothetical protein
MNETFDSVYPDLLKTGLDKLRLLDARRELVALFSALEHFRSDLHVQESTDEILQVTQRYIAGLDLFRATGFWLVNPRDFSFELALVSPETKRTTMEKIIRREIKGGRFAWALRQDAPVFFQAETAGRGVLHSLAISNRVVGMFGGLLHPKMLQARDVSFSLFTLLLGESADALAALQKTRQLTSQIETLSGLLPLCAWCKKVRNDRGYWEQIDNYISTRSGAKITHSVCPECRDKFLKNHLPKSNGRGGISTVEGKNTHA